MSNLSKQKGKRGETEMAQLLTTLLGEVQKKRKVAGLPTWEYGPQAFNDSQANGADIQSIPGLAIEVKRHETLSLKAWWAQAERQADDLGSIPIVAYRQNRKPWKFLLPGYLLGIGISGYVHTEESTFGDWLYLYLS